MVLDVLDGARTVCSARIWLNRRLVFLVVPVVLRNKLVLIQPSTILIMDCMKIIDKNKNIQSGIGLESLSSFKIVVLNSSCIPNPRTTVPIISADRRKLRTIMFITRNAFFTVVLRSNRAAANAAMRVSRLRASILAELHSCFKWSLDRSSKYFSSICGFFVLQAVV